MAHLCTHCGSLFASQSELSAHAEVLERERAKALEIQRRRFKELIQENYEKTRTQLERMAERMEAARERELISQAAREQDERMEALRQFEEERARDRENRDRLSQRELEKMVARARVAIAAQNAAREREKQKAQAKKLARGQQPPPPSD